MSDIFRSQQMTSHLRTAGWKREALGESVFMKAVIFLEVAGQQIFIRSSVCGYRIGIRSPSGGYFYYAHLSSYERDWKEGDSIKAGEILGFMGDTGYGSEGTKGKFPVHLHLGIYIQTPYSREMSVNPYWVLKAVQKKIRKGVY